MEMKETRFADVRAQVKEIMRDYSIPPDYRPPFNRGFITASEIIGLHRAGKLIKKDPAGGAARRAFIEELEKGRQKARAELLEHEAALARSILERWEIPEDVEDNLVPYSSPGEPGKTKYISAGAVIALFSPRLLNEKEEK